MSADRKKAEEAREELAARIIAGTTTRADVAWIVESLDAVTAERDEARATLAAALARGQRKDEALRRLADYCAWVADGGMPLEMDDVVRDAREALAAVPVETRPCPKGDDCALNRGARTCRACGRNWPPDKTWDAPAVPVATQEAAASDDYSRPGWRMFPVM